MIKEYVAFVKDYLLSLRKFILFSLAVFVLALFFGYFSAQSSPAKVMPILNNFQETFGPILEMPPPAQFLAIFLNNSLTVLLVIFLGIILGVFPFLVLSFNGFFIGIVSYFVQAERGWFLVFALIMPHGIIEIPAILIACAVGFRMGKVLLAILFRKQGDFKRETKTALIFFLKFLLPLLLLAAAIETLVLNRF